MKTPRAVILAAALSALMAFTAPAQTGDDAKSHDHNSTGGTVLLIPRDLEIRLAVNALPKELREGAAILVLEPTGYTKVRAGTNLFTCFVSRRGGNFYPVCFDEDWD